MNGYALIEKSSEIQLVTYTSLPKRISLPSNPGGTLAMGDDLSNWEDDVYKLISVILPEPEEVPNYIIDGVEFLSRVTDQEYSNIMAASQQSVTLARWIDTLRLLGYVNMASEVAMVAKAGLVQANLLTQERADVIFAT